MCYNGNYQIIKESSLLYKKMLFHRDTLLKQICQLKQEISQCPEGYLLCITKGKYIRNLHVLNHVRTYIPQKNHEFVKKLAKKKYLCALQKDLLKELDAVNAFLKKYQNYKSQTEKILSNPNYQKMIYSSLTPLSLELAQWAAEPYDKNSSYPEQLRFPCISSHIVRSKSEMLIDQSLFIHQIPFRYECPVQFDKITIYPDFTIRHPDTGQIFYWEHFGMMDSLSYSQNAFQKLQIYSTHGYIPSINLITTYETKEHPLTAKKIEGIVQQYFL